MLFYGSSDPCAPSSGRGVRNRMASISESFSPGIIGEARTVTGTPERLNSRIAVSRLAGVGAAAKCPHLLRRVVVWDAEKGREIVLLTNHLDFGATTIAAIYKQRWQIELFFKALKQNLKVKTFIGTTENALRIQIWTALIAMMLLKWLHHLSKAGWSLSNLAAMLRMNLFTYRDLKAWLDRPFETPPAIPIAEQLTLALPGLGQPTVIAEQWASTQIPAVSRAEAL